MGHRHLGELPTVLGHAGLLGRCSCPLVGWQAPLEEGLGPSSSFLAHSQAIGLGHEISSAVHHRPRHGDRHAEAGTSLDHEAGTGSITQM
eukprot:10835201-Heterocapsa_arctica.AAC.1